jgi:hypothetical protein
MATPAIDQVRPFVRTAIQASAGEAADALRAVMTRLDEPLRVAIAGKVKAGKSTLLNALVGEVLAPTDAGECTKVVTWYRNGPAYRVSIRPRGEDLREARFARVNGPIQVDLEGRPAEEIDLIEVDWPSAALRSATLIDTPGIASLSTDLAQRTHAFLAPEDDPAEADAIVYLMRHAHTSDVRFLEAFHDDEPGRPSPVTAIGVLSRCDELGGGAADSLEAAERIAARYRNDNRVRRLCQTVLPVSALLAETAATLRETEFAALASLASLSMSETEALLLSADRFARTDAAGVPEPQRVDLLRRFGLFGVRYALDAIRKGRIGNASELAELLMRSSGIHGLRRELATRFESRANTLKARSALAAVEAILRRTGAEDSALWTELERIRSGAHEFSELRVLTAIRTGELALNDDDAREAERLLGAFGASAAERAGVEPGASADDVRAGLLGSIGRWRAKAEAPIASAAVIETARVLVRTCEGLLADV